MILDGEPEIRRPRTAVQPAESHIEENERPLSALPPVHLFQPVSQTATPKNKHLLAALDGCKVSSACQTEKRCYNRRQQVQLPFMNVKMLKNKGLLKSYTGLECDAFDSLVLGLSLLYDQNQSMRLQIQETLDSQLLICLMKLRCNFTFEHIGLLFNFSRRKASRIFYAILEALDIILGTTVTSIPNPEDCRLIQPTDFRHPLTNKITLCIDCTDFRIDCPRQSLAVGRSCYSEYRGGYTLKALIAIMPFGAISFCSELFGGRISDKDICKKSGFFSKLGPGHVLAVDKGFKIREDVPKGVDIAIPSFKVKGKQFTVQQAIVLGQFRRQGHMWNALMKG